jgi:hypothetical protein
MEKSESDFAQIGDLRVAKPLQAFIEDEALPGTGICAVTFWKGLAVLARDSGSTIGNCLRSVTRSKQASTLTTGAIRAGR